MTSNKAVVRLFGEPGAKESFSDTGRFRSWLAKVRHCQKSLQVASLSGTI
jgi:hypothetical protein